MTTRWKRIKSCPRDGRKFVGGYYSGDRWYWTTCEWILTDPYHPAGYMVSHGGGKPTHWVDVPPPPRRKK